MSKKQAPTTLYAPTEPSEWNKTGAANIKVNRTEQREGAMIFDEGAKAQLPVSRSEFTGSYRRLS